MCRKRLTPSEARKHRKGICISVFCTTEPKKYKTGTRPLRCSACRRREWAQRNPEKYIFANLRGNARRRRKDFGLTFQFFIVFLTKENYLMRIRGRTAFSISIDRVNNKRGYYDDNIAAITIRSNSWKRNYVDYYRMQGVEWN